MGSLFLGMFCVFRILHLVSSWRSDQKGRAKTKPFLIFSLGLYYLFSEPEPSRLLLAALLTSWLGDVLLIPKGHKWFLLGGISFLLSHFFFIGMYLPHIRFAAVPWLRLIPVALVYLVLSVKTVRSVRDNTPKIMLLPMWLYLLANSAMNLLALMQLLTCRNAGAAVAFTGAVLFFASDCILFLVRYHRNPDLIPRHHFPVMLCYLSGEFLLTLGMGMLL